IATNPPTGPEARPGCFGFLPSRRPSCWPWPASSVSFSDACARRTARRCDANGSELHKGDRRRSGDRVRLARGFRACAEQAPADGFGNKRERLLGFTRFSFGCLSAKLQRHEAILIGGQSRLSLLQGSGGVLQLAIDIHDGFP